jgi:hypothetical protein
VKKKKLHSYANSPAYKKWVLARDKALEQLHLNAQLRQTDEMRRGLTDVLLAAKAHYHDLKNLHQAHSVDRLEQIIKDLLRRTGDQLFLIHKMMKIRSYILAKSSETEIIAQLNPRKRIENKIDFSELLNKHAEESFAGGSMYHRIQMYMDRLARKIVNQAQSSALNAPDEAAFLFDVLQSFPQRKVYKRPPRILKPKLMTEADKTPKVDIAIDILSENEWRDMVDDYLEEYIPKWRAPEYVIDIPVTDPTIQATTGEEVWYTWEFERDMTQEFVQAVRDGQIQSANDAGITDFVWIAILDSVTDSCCRWRDGLLISEIESQLSQHEDEDDECRLENDGLVPPIHFNCRCTIAPVTENIPDKPDDSSKDFESWLNS